MLWMKWIQQLEFFDDTLIQTGKELPKKFCHLTPIIGPDGLVRIRQHFWIINLMKVIRHCTHNCVTCAVHRASTMEQTLGNLPASRTRTSGASTMVGVDYGGPIIIKSWKGRGVKTKQAYFTLFVCSSTKAVHLESVSDLTTKAFIASLHRFTGVPEKPEKSCSDNGTDFVGADRELKELHEILQSQEHKDAVADFCSSRGIQWTFVSPGALHQGGPLEAGIKSMMTPLRRITGTSTLTLEELMTALHQISACLTSRRITPLSTDPNDGGELTPGHLLIGRSLQAAPDPDVSHVSENQPSRWQLSQEFWNRWTKEHQTELQQRNKWIQPRESIAVGDPVPIKENYMPPLKLARGRVSELHPRKNFIPSQVRVVTLKTWTVKNFNTNTIIHDVRILVKLPIDCE
jgi:hypothetical protein